jgi:hypothetical protein
VTSDDAAAPQTAGSRGASVAAATDALRAATKWILAALAGTSAALITGLSLAPLGHLTGARLALAVASALVTLAAILTVIVGAARVLTDEWLTLGQLDDEAFDLLLQGTGWRQWRSRRRVRLLHHIRDLVDRDGQTMFAHVAESVQQLHRLQRLANRASRAALAADPTPAGGTLWADYLNAAAHDVTECANYHQTRIAFKKLTRRVVLAGTVTSVTVLSFAWSANPDQPAPGPIQVRIVR